MCVYVCECIYIYISLDLSAGIFGCIGGEFGRVGEITLRRACTLAEVVSLPMQPIMINLVESASFLEWHFAERC